MMMMAMAMANKHAKFSAFVVVNASCSPPSSSSSSYSLLDVARVSSRRRYS